MTDPHEDETRRLLGVAADTEVPSAVDVNRAVADGTRRVRRRRLIASVAAVVGLAAIGLGTVGGLSLGRGTPAPPLSSARQSPPPMPSALATGPVVAPANLGDISPQRVAGAATRNGLLVATRGRDGRINVRTPGSGVWTALDGPVTSSPSATSLGNDVYLAARGKTGDVLLRWTSGGTWTDWTSLGGGPTTSAPSITAIGGKLLVTVRKSADELEYAVVRPADLDANWLATGVTTSAAPIAMPIGDARGCAAVTTRGDGDAKVYRQQICADGSSSTGMVKPFFDTRVSSGASIVGGLVWFRGLNGHLWLWSGGGAPTQIGTPPNIATTRIACTPTVVMSSSDTLVVLVRTPTAEVWAYTAPLSAPTRGQWEPYGGYAS
ncbi:hypothetical protein [Fodinicola acaciae]|uniref:hypothetical protein n=1 Tax=Fodinicola acaciae TaxID=2681555 RepID=UPI0013D703E6|nr:hypothetical protein [Fodinicola acaciae]